MKMESPQFTEEFLISRPATSGYFFRALLETAEENGGQEFRDIISEAAVSRRSLWPKPEALQLMESTYPGSVDAVGDRSREIQDAAHAAELRALHRDSKKRLGSAVLRGVLAGIFGNVRPTISR